MEKGTMKPCPRFSFNRGVIMECHADKIAAALIVKISFICSFVNTLSNRNRNNQLSPIIPNLSPAFLSCM